MLTGRNEEQTTADHPLDTVFHHALRPGVSFSFFFEIGLCFTQRRRDAKVFLPKTADRPLDPVIDHSLRLRVLV